MRHGTAALVALFAALFAHPLQHDPPVPQRRVIGLVEIPRLFPAQDRDARPHEVAVNLYQDPVASSPIAMTIRDPERIDTREHGYEEVSGVVYERRGRWYLLRSGTRFAWLPPADAGAFRPYPELLKERLTYLTRDWDRALHVAPGGHVSAKVPTVPSDQPLGEPYQDFGDTGADPSDVTVLDQRQDAGEWWLRVRLEPSVCRTAPEPPRVIGEGWVPAYGASGRPTVWFFSRGC